MQRHHIANLKGLWLKRLRVSYGKRVPFTRVGELMRFLKVEVSGSPCLLIIDTYHRIIDRYLWYACFLILNTYPYLNKIISY